MMTKNYIRTSGLLPWRAYYFYLDKEPWLADRIFVDRDLCVHFKDEFEMPGIEYHIVTCWVNKRKSEEFERCMFELHRLSLMSGRDDYAKTCGELSWLFEADKEG